MLKLPIVLHIKELKPIAVLLCPVVLLTKDPLPIAVFVEIFPPPLPTVKLLIVASVSVDIEPVTINEPEINADPLTSN